MDATGFPLDEAVLIGSLTGAIFYGAFAVFFFTALYVLFQRRKTARPNWVLVFAAVGMFTLATIIEGLSWSKILDAFIFYRNTIGPLKYLENVSNWKEVTRTGLLCVYLLLADGALVYRCWIVWSGRWSIVALPIFLFIGDIAIVIGIIVTMARTFDTSFFAKDLSNWTVAVISCTLAQNIIVVSLIVFRILQVHRATQKHRSTTGASLIPVVAVVVESGLLYVTGLFIFLVTYVTKSNSMRIIYDAMNGIIGLAFTMMIVRVGLGLTGGQTQASTGSKHTSSNPPSNSLYPLQPVSVGISRRVDLNRSFDTGNTSEIDVAKPRAVDTEADSPV